MATLHGKTPDLQRRWNGPLTAELLQSPGAFGLGNLPVNAHPDATSTSICGFCSTGCQLSLHLSKGEAAGLTPTPDYPVNLGMACPKGWEALAVLDDPSRATHPLLRDDKGRARRTDWQKAATTFRDRFRNILQKHGRESVAFLSTGQIATEEMAFLGAFAKFGMGLLHGDGNTRQCMATSVVSYKESFGFDAPPYTYADFEESDVIVLVGSNLCIAHPILWQRVMRNKRSPEIIVIDPRRTETAQAATWHVPVRSKGDLSLLLSLAHCLVRDGSLDRHFLSEHTTGFEEFADFVSDYAPTSCEEATGLRAHEIESLARRVSKPGKRVSWWWTMGVNQSHEGVRTAQAIINLALMTGNIGKPGTGANSITGQCNAMGSRLFSNTTSLLGGHDFANADHRCKIANLLEIPEERIPDRPSLAYDQIVDGIEQGRIRGLWVIATNPAHSWIHQGRLRNILDKLEFLVVQDMYMDTETARHADLLLPAASWGEKAGTFINSERRIGTIKQVHRAPGQALSDFRIIQLLATTWGCDDLFRKWTTPEAVFHILQKCSAGQPCDITGIAGYEDLDRAGGIQWPFPAGGPPLQRERRLFEDGQFCHPDGRARFRFDPPGSVPEPVCEEFPFTLLTGRGSSAQWHTETRTSKSAVLRKLHPDALILELHPADARLLGIHTNDRVTVRSRRGELTATAFPTPTMRRGEVFLPMHDSSTNRLTLQSVDPFSRQPAYKACAVALKWTPS